jgi:signal transduction histidine kinase/ligand-binding sensor domain-containing protein
LGVLSGLAESSNYLIDVWDSENDLPNSTVTAIAQTPDGYMWIGTYNGLARFDGIRFVTFDPVNTPALGHARIQDLFVDESGTLWVNTYRGGLTSYRNGSFQREWQGPGEFDLHTFLAFSSSNVVVFATQFGEVVRREVDSRDNKVSWKTFTPSAGARFLYECTGAEGVLWFLSRDGHIVRFIDGEFKELEERCRPAGTKTITLAADRHGQVWAGTDKGIERWDGKAFENMTPTNGETALEAMLLLPTQDGGVWVLADGRMRKQLGRSWVAEAREWRGLLGWASGRSMGMHEDREGGVWFNHYGNGLFHLSPDGHYQRFTTTDGLAGDRIWTWFEGREGDIWLGIDRGGLARLRERRFQVIGPAEGLSARAALSVCQDENGAMWFGTSGGGLCRWMDGEIQKFSVGNDASANFVFSVIARRGQGLWLSASAGEDLFLFQDGRVQRGPWDGVHGVKSLLVDKTGRVWIGTKSGLNWWTEERRRNFTMREGGPDSAVRALAEARNGDVWCGTDGGTLYRCDGEQLQAFRPVDALAGQPIWSLLASDKDDTVWAGTFRGGLLRFKGGKFGRVTTEQGLPSDVITGLLEDGEGRLWLATHQGICQVAKSELNACLEGRSRRLDCVTYGRFDGLPTLECSGNYQPSCWRASDGRLWFSTVKGMVSVKPRELKINPVLPPVVIEDLRVDGERQALDTAALHVRPGPTQFEFGFTALSFIAPDKVRFRYKLDGLDKDWVEAGTRRTAHYAHLPAGQYRFEVLACNNDGVWNQKGAELAFTVLPHIYETRWFLTMSALLILGAVAGAVRSATTRKYRVALARLEQKHAIERDRARIAKDIHDDLGAGLTQITLLSELARREPPGQAVPHLDRITESARQMTRAMDEIVWAVDPQHDTLNGLMDYASAFTEDFLRVAGIRCRIDVPAELPPVRLDAEMRYNLFLSLKEALNNVVKHAHATLVWLRLRFDPNRLTLVVEDNGQGFPRNGTRETGERARSGHGLPNLEKRLASIGGSCTVRSEPGKGTRVELTVLLETGASPVMGTGRNGHEGAE